MLEDDSEVEEVFESMEKNGKIECDIPSKIVSAKLAGANDVQCLLEWNNRYDGTQPRNSYVSNKILKSKYPAILIDYYESKLKIEKRS